MYRLRNFGYNNYRLRAAFLSRVSFRMIHFICHVNSVDLRFRLGLYRHNGFAVRHGTHL